MGGNRRELDNSLSVRIRLGIVAGGDATAGWWTRHGLVAAVEERRGSRGQACLCSTPNATTELQQQAGVGLRRGLVAARGRARARSTARDVRQVGETLRLGVRRQRCGAGRPLGGGT